MPIATAQHCRCTGAVYSSVGNEQGESMSTSVKQRDMSGCHRHPPNPRFQPFAFYSSIRLGDPEMLAIIMACDPYFLTQDNGSGAPIHFAATYGQLDMLHHLLNNGAEVNQRDPRGLTALHRAAHLSHLGGYLDIYEYLLSRGADPSIGSNADYEEYLSPGVKYPSDMAANEGVAAALHVLEQKYAHVPKAPEPSPYMGDWWCLYDYGPDHVSSWGKDHVPRFPEEVKRQRDRDAARARKAALKEKKHAFLTALATQGEAAARDVAAQKLPSSGPATAASAPNPADTSAQGSSAATSTTTPTAALTAFLFPGQGSQVVGMLKESSHLPAVRAMLDTAHQVLGYDLLAKCVEGPQSELDNTVIAQPALFVAGLAAAEKLRSQDPRSWECCGAAAGLSLGEYCALVWAGALEFEEALKVVKVRAEAMSEAARAGEPHGMLSVVGLPDTDLADICEQVRKAVVVQGGPTVCQVANYLFPQGRVVSGHVTALQQVKDQALTRGALKAQMLAVTGAFHTPLMQPARDALAKALASAPVRAPRVPVYSNVTAQPFPSDPDAIRELLARQLTEPVQWQATLSSLIKSDSSEAGAKTGGVARLYELGPGQQIKAMVRRMDRDVWNTLTNVAP